LFIAYIKPYAKVSPRALCKVIQVLQKKSPPEKGSIFFAKTLQFPQHLAFLLPKVSYMLHCVLRGVSAIFMLPQNLVTNFYEQCL